VVHGTLVGPDNPFLRQPEKVKAPFTAFLDAERRFIACNLGQNTYSRCFVEIRERFSRIKFRLRIICPKAMTKHFFGLIVSDCFESDRRTG